MAITNPASASIFTTAHVVEGALTWDDAHTPRLESTSLEPLASALLASEAFGARSKEGLFLQAASRAVLALRRTVIDAGSGAWSDSMKAEVDRLLIESQSLQERVPELREAAKHVAVRGQVREVASQLEQATSVLLRVDQDGAHRCGHDR